MRFSISLELEDDFTSVEFYFTEKQYTILQNNGWQKIFMEVAHQEYFHEDLLMTKQDFGLLIEGDLFIWRLSPDKHSPGYFANLLYVVFNYEGDIREEKMPVMAEPQREEVR